MDAGVAVTLIHFQHAHGVVVSLGADAREAVDAVLTGSAVVARVAGTLVDVDVAHSPCVSWLAGTFIAIDLV